MTSEEKFNGIKVGDVVFQQKKIIYGWKSFKTFWVPVKVIKVTAKRFMLSSSLMVRKSDGKLIGGDYFVKKEGEKNGLEKVSNELQKMQCFKRKLAIESHINSVLREINEIEGNSRFSINELNELLNAARKLRDLRCVESEKKCNF